MKKLPLLTALLAVLLMGGEGFAYIPAQNPSTAQILVLISDSATTQRAYADTTTHTKASGVTTNNQRVGSLTVDTGATIGDSLRAASLRIGTRIVQTASVIDSALTGYATTPSDTLRVSADLLTVCIYQVAGFSATANTTALTFGHIPTWARPSHAQTVRVYGVKNNGVTRAGNFAIATTGIVTAAYDSTASIVTPTFTNNTTNGISALAGGCYPRF